MSDPVPATAAVASQLELAKQQVEDRFRTAGLVLAEVLQVIERLIDALQDLTGAIKDDAIVRTTADLQAAAEQLSTIPDAQAVRNARLANIRSATVLLSPHVQNMRQTLQYLRVFVFNIKIAAAGAKEFSDFTAEMTERVEFGVGELAVFDAQVAELSRSIVEALGSEANLGRQCATVLPGVRRDLAADAEALREHHAVVAATAQRVAGLAQSVQVKVGRALGGLQIGDTTRQRIEHVQTAIEMVERYENDPASPTDLDRARLARAVRRMLAAQMADAVSHFRRDAGQVSESLAGMAEDADQILRLKDLTYGGSAANGESFLRSLERSVDGAKSLVATVHAASREADEIARSTASTANILTGRIAGVKQVRFDIHLMALNTALRCRHMGEAGRPLAAIATELRGYADKLDSLAYGAASALGQLATDAASNQGEPTAEVDPNTVLDGAINQIRVAGNGAESSLRRLALQSGDVAELLARTERQLDFSRDLTEAMEAAAETLTRLAGTDDEPLSEAQAADLAPLFDEIGALYTMAREREIHAQGAPSNGQAAPQAPVVVASSGGDDLDDFLF